MEHVEFLEAAVKEMEHWLNGQKTMFIRGVAGRPDGDIFLSKVDYGSGRLF